MADVVNSYHLSIQDLFFMIQQEVTILNNQNNRLKFLAPEIIRNKLQEITDGYQQLFTLTNSYIGNCGNLFFQEEASKIATEKYNETIQPINLKLRSDMESIEQLLRDDLFS